MTEPRRPGAGRRALFSDPAEKVPKGPLRVDRPDSATTGDIPRGRRALFSEPAPRPPGPAPVEPPAGVVSGRTTAIVQCRTCLARTPVSLLALGVSLVPSLWIPARPWPRLMRCPSCRRVSWCRIEWPDLHR